MLGDHAWHWLVKVLELEAHFLEALQDLDDELENERVKDLC